MKDIRLDILAFAAHPDDVELAASGTLLKHIDLGKKIGIIDLTMGELGTRGSSKLRLEEAKQSSSILSLTLRENLNLGDGFFEISQKELIKIIEKIRQYKPDVVLCNSINDRHPDHKRAGDLVSRACYLSGLVKIETKIKDKNQKPYRPRAVYRYIQERWVEPSFVVDISNYFEKKMQTILSFESQFYKKDDDNKPQTVISSKTYLHNIKARARGFGQYINVEFAEGFTIERPIGIEDITKLI
jgi:bacillithiol biosynthesis deacetylase BshB1